MRIIKILSKIFFLQYFHLSNKTRRVLEEYLQANILNRSIKTIFNENY
jgi:hypothetical protein